MKETPILFNGQMVRAILGDRKTQTRRCGGVLVAIGENQEPPKLHVFGERIGFLGVLPDGSTVFSPCPYGKPGDHLWVRETFRLSESNDCSCYEPCGCKVGVPIYRATANMEREEKTDPPWKPSIFMPRWACRLTLEITDVRVQRLQDITDLDAIAEGSRCWVCGGPVDGTSENDCQCFHTKSAAVGSYCVLWDSINSKPGFGWDKNPWVWAVSFRKL